MFVQISERQAPLHTSLESVASARTIFFITFSVTRQEIFQFTWHTSVKTVTLHTFFHSENHISM